jgi:hypothetical protein
LAQSISAYVGCIAGASLMNDYLNMALSVGLKELSIPVIAYGKEIVALLAPDGFSTTEKKTCCGGSLVSLKNPDQAVREASEALASIKLHGRK